jgi:hypothetical protein
MGMTFLPERYKIVEAISPKSSSSARTGDCVSLKNVKQAYVIVQIMGGDAVYATIYESTGTTVTGAATTGNTYDIWSNASTTGGDTLTARTASYRYASTTAATYQMIVFGIDPADLTDSYDCIYVGTGASTAATKFVSALYLLESAYPADQPPTAIAD